MKKGFLALVLFLIPTLAFAQVDPDIVASSVLVRIPGIQSGSGTCFHVQDGIGYILTNKHVVTTRTGLAKTIHVEFKNGERKAARLVGVSDKVDLSCIAVSGDENTKFIPLSQTAPEWGVPLVQVGYPHGNYKERTGTVIGYRTNMIPQSFIPSFTVDHGDSGSGIFANKQLVGVVWGYAVHNGSKETQAVQLADINGFTLKIFDGHILQGLRGNRAQPGAPNCPGGNCPIPPKSDPGVIPPPGEPVIPPPGVPKERILDKIKDKVESIDPATKAAIADAAKAAAEAAAPGALTMIGAATGGVGVPVALGIWALGSFFLNRKKAAPIVPDVPASTPTPTPPVADPTSDLRDKLLKMGLDLLQKKLLDQPAK